MNGFDRYRRSVPGPAEGRALLLFLLLAAGRAQGGDPHRIIVAQDGSGDYRTITEALASLPMFNYERVVIFVRKGVYREKVHVSQDFVTLCGEDRARTVVAYSQLRSDWDTRKDSIGPAVVNIESDDVVLEHLTIENTQPVVGPHAFAVYVTGTRLVAVDCAMLSNGGDTVAPWDYKRGMYYFADCSFRGAVDCVCPRGWCFIRNSSFYEMKKTASLWHAGGYDETQKFVLRHCSFDGVQGFELARHHYDAQFYLVDCSFSERLGNSPPYRVTYDDPVRNRPSNWGERDYFSGCHRAGGDYPWMRDNLQESRGAPSPGDVTPLWTFGGTFDPEDTTAVCAVRCDLSGTSAVFTFPEVMTVVGRPFLRSEKGVVLRYDSGAGSVALKFDADRTIARRDLGGLRLAGGGAVTPSAARVHDPEVEFSTTH